MSTNNIKYIASTFLVSVLVIVFVGFILSFFNLSNTSDKSYGLTTLNLVIYKYIIFGVVLILILNKCFNNDNISNLKNLLLNNLKYFVIESLPIMIILISIISLIIINYKYTFKINSGDLTDSFYFFNKIHLIVLFLQLIIYYYNIKNKAKDTSMNMTTMGNYVLSFVNIITTLIIIIEAYYYSTDG